MKFVTPKKVKTEIQTNINPIKAPGKISGEILNKLPIKAIVK